MDALTLLEQRVSSPILGDLPPTQQQLDRMFAAAVRAPDHAALRPWRFLTISGDARKQLGEVFLEASLAIDPELSETQQRKTLDMPLRAPTMIIVIASPRSHPKVPEVEQLLSAGAAAQNILLSAFAQGVGAMWRTGTMAYCPQVDKGLGLEQGEKIIGFIYLGSQPEKLKRVRQLDSAEFVQAWPQEE